MNRLDAAVGAALLLAFGLGGCSTQDRITTAAAHVRSTKPLVEWIDVQPEHLAEVDPARLKGEGAAVLITRSLVETASGERNGSSDVTTLRDVSTSTIRQSPVRKTGTDAEVGWAVLIVPPGQYAVNRGATRRTTRVRGTTELQDHVVDSKGHPFVPLSATTRINAGDVAYVGTVVRQDQPGSQTKKTFVRDERAAAAAWTQTNLPGFAPQFQVKLLPPPVQPLS